MSNGNVPPVVPQYSPSPSGKSGVTYLLIAAAVAVPVLLVCAGVLVALLLPAVQAAREAARRMQCSNNIKQVVLALHNYENTYGTFPPAYTEDASGRRLHSWRTLILPYLGEQTLYSQIDLSKPWDDPSNIAIADMVVLPYACPSAGVTDGYTTYVGVVDPSGLFSGAQGEMLSSISDGTSNTLLVVETDTSRAVQWMSTDDLDLPTFKALGSIRANHPGIINVGMSDGSVQAISTQLSPEALEALVTKDAGDMVSFGY